MEEAPELKRGIDSLESAQAVAPDTDSLDNGIGLDVNGHIVSNFDKETNSWIQAEVSNYAETLMAISNKVPFVDKEGNEIFHPQIEIL